MQIAPAVKDSDIDPSFCLRAFSSTGQMSPWNLERWACERCAAKLEKANCFDLCTSLMLSHLGPQDAARMQFGSVPVRRSLAHSLCSTTVKPMNAIMAVFSHGYSLSNIVT